MLRVLLKVDEVHIKIREVVDIHLVVRKDSKNFTHIRSQQLREGELALSATSQFFVAKQSPVFDIEVYLIKGAVKKKGGVVHIDLRQLHINSSHRMRLPIEDSPLKNSCLFVDLLYMVAQRTVPMASLLSLHEIQATAHESLLEQLSSQNNLLEQEGVRLRGEIQGLVEGNFNLNLVKEHLQSALALQDTNNKTKMCEIQQQREQSKGYLQQEKEKLNTIMALINGKGDRLMMEEMMKIVQHIRGLDTGAK